MPGNRTYQGHDGIGDDPSRNDARIRQDGLDDSEKIVSTLMHLWPVGTTVVGPLALALPFVLWLVQKQRSPFVDDHGREVINFLLSFVIINALLAITIIGMAALPFVWIYAVVSVIRGAIAAGHGEYFRYPMTIRMLG